MDSDLRGVISVSDTLREGIATSIKEMKQNGVKKVVMLTGDNSYVAEKISKEASIDETWAELLPEEKVEHVKKYQSQGYMTTMIGDGVNDAPALATADIGIAMGVSGTDVAIETAGIVLTTDDLAKVSKLIKLSQKTLIVIKQNIMFSLAVNILGLILSALGVITPITASIVHESSALIVVFNSLRLATNKM
jgi:P-type E1-E2 ATPase